MNWIMTSRDQFKRIFSIGIYYNFNNYINLHYVTITQIHTKLKPSMILSIKNQKTTYQLKFNTINTLIFLFLIISCTSQPIKKTTVEANVFSQAITLNTITQTTPPLIFWSHLNREVLNLPRYSEINAPINLWKYIDDDKTQLWTIEKMDKDFVIRSCEQNRVLAVNLKDSSIVQQNFEGKTNQLWTFSGDNDSIRIINKATSKYLAIINKRLRIVDRSKYKDQLWKIKTPQSFQNEKEYCDGAENYEFVKDWVESSYPGFADKVTAKTKIQYDSLCNELATKAKETEKVSVCYSIISKYIDFFKDKHLCLIPVFGNISVDSHYKSLPGAESFELVNVDDSTLLFSLPNFHIEKKEIIDFLIKTNKNKLLKTPYLIIDVRNNGGGGDPSWQGIIPYLYTNPIKSTGNDLFVSREMIREGDELRHWDKDYLRHRKTVMEFIEKNHCKFYPNCSDGFDKYPSITHNPKRVVILSNENNGSSGEQFLLAAKQSKKVIIMGQPSRGVLDYSNVASIQCPSFAFQLCCPTTRSRRLPEYSVDKEKIKPDIYLEYNEDWVKEAVKVLRKKSQTFRAKLIR